MGDDGCRMSLNGTERHFGNMRQRIDGTGRPNVRIAQRPT